MSCELYEGKPLSTTPFQMLGEPKSSLSAWKLKVLELVLILGSLGFHRGASGDREILSDLSSPSFTETLLFFFNLFFMVKHLVRFFFK